MRFDSNRTGADVVATGVTGDVRARAPLIVDPVITTGGTIAAARLGRLAIKRLHWQESVRELRARV